MLPGESGFPILAFALSRDSDGVLVDDQFGEIGSAESTAAPRIVPRRVTLLSILIFHIVFSYVPDPAPNNSAALTAAQFAMATSYRPSVMSDRVMTRGNGSVCADAWRDHDEIRKPLVAGRNKRSLPCGADASIPSDTPAGLANVVPGYALAVHRGRAGTAACTHLRDQAIRLKKWRASHCLRRCCSRQGKARNSDKPDHSCSPLYLRLSGGWSVSSRLIVRRRHRIASDAAPRRFGRREQQTP